MEQTPDWWEWVNRDVPSGSPKTLKDNAPEDVKKKFEEWNRKRQEYEASFYK